MALKSMGIGGAVWWMVFARVYDFRTEKRT